jgi:hypothetical protein
LYGRKSWVLNKGKYFEEVLNNVAFAYILGKSHAFSGPIRNNTNLQTVHWPEYEGEMIKTYLRTANSLYRLQERRDIDRPRKPLGQITEIIHRQKDSSYNILCHRRT